MLQEESTIALPQDQREALDAELEALIEKFNVLFNTAADDPNQWRLTGTYDNYLDRFKKAQAIVNAGLSIDSAKCVGQGKGSPGSGTSTSAAPRPRTCSRSPTSS